MNNINPHVIVRDLTMAYGSRIIQENVTFEVKRGDVFIIMGGSGCGKSTLMQHLIGLRRPKSGAIEVAGQDLWESTEEQRSLLMRRMGVLFQSGALWSSMTLAENVGVPLREFTDLNTDQINDVVSFKLSLVGLSGFGDHYPSEISGGMRKRAGLARALALDPEILFVDEPSAGLDPLSARRLDDLLLALKDSLGTTIIVVTHELASIFAIGDDSVFLDPETKTAIAHGNPTMLLETSQDSRVKTFLSRGEQ